LVVDNVADVTIANAFKISEKIAIKEDSEKYDLKLFWKAFMNECIDRDKPKWALITSQCMRELAVNGINKQMLFDKWVMILRRNNG
jgi:hypothetical protein